MPPITPNIAVIVGLIGLPSLSGCNGSQAIGFVHRQAALAKEIVAGQVDMLTMLSQRPQVWTVLDNFCKDFIWNL
jgi:hypothetical protein